MEVEDSFKMMSQMAVSEPYEMEVERIESQVKWFNPEKGYGFLSPDDGSADIFMHFSVLEAAGHRRVDSGDVLVCEIGPGKRGRQVLRVLEVKLMPRDMRQMAPVFQMARAPHADPDALEEIYGEIKWFNPLRGYGFLSPDDGSADIFMHFSVLEAAGHRRVDSGDVLVCEIGPGKRGRQVLRVLEVKLMPRDMRQMAPVFQMARAPHADPDALEEIYGEIKWFNPLRGYGFICPDDGGREIFVHASVLRALGYETLEPGIRVHAKVSSSSRGREARIIEIIR